MLKKAKTPPPEWTSPFVATWTGEQWIVEFTSERGARRGMTLMQEGVDVHLACALLPWSNHWYVGVVD